MAVVSGGGEMGLLIDFYAGINRGRIPLRMIATYLLGTSR